MSKKTKDEVIESVYNDRAGYGSITKTYNDAKAKDSTITNQDVKDWFSKNVENKRKLRGYNSFINDGPYEEYQVDVAFIQGEPALVMIDIFTKYAVVIPLESQETPDFLAGLMEGFQKMGHKPKMIYADGEGALRSKLFAQFCNEQKINFHLTRTHAWVVERFNRTLKNMMNRRLEANKDKKKTWKDFIFEVMLTYSNKDIHTAHGMTPSQARKDINRTQVKSNLELNRVAKRKYPDIKVGDKVKVYKKKPTGGKEDLSYWLPTVQTVQEITETFGQKYYHVSGWKKPMLRHELLKVT
jgi:hypothetical protein